VDLEVGGEVEMEEDPEEKEKGELKVRKPPSLSISVEVKRVRLLRASSDVWWRTNSRVLLGKGSWFLSMTGGVDEERVEEWEGVGRTKGRCCGGEGAMARVSFVFASDDLVILRMEEDRLRTLKSVVSASLPKDWVELERVSRFTGSSLRSRDKCSTAEALYVIQDSTARANESPQSESSNLNRYVRLALRKENVSQKQKEGNRERGEEEVRHWRSRGTRNQCTSS